MSTRIQYPLDAFQVIGTAVTNLYREEDELLEATLRLEAAKEAIQVDRFPRFPCDGCDEQEVVVHTYYDPVDGIRPRLCDACAYDTEETFGTTLALVRP